ncbi:MAG: response regulator [Acidobacteriota bacterium]|nr:response regulator [Acidobacteriota bacterium]
MAKAKTHKIKMMEEQLSKKLSRQVVGSLVGCVHCGMCDQSCHYVLAFPDDHKMTPSYKADQVRKLFKANHDWTGSVFPWWVGADKVPLTDDDLETLKDISFGTCTNCRRCTLSCPMGVDTATLNRVMRGLLTHVGVMPEGVRVVSKDQWELGNQMGVLKEDYLDTLEWMSEELEEDLGHDKATIPVEKKGAKVMYCINPREVKYDPRTIKEAALVFWAAGEDWTMPEDGWDNTNFGLFSGDDGLGGACAKREYDKARELGVEKIVISECGHGFRSTRFEGVNWAGEGTPVEMESSVQTMLNYVKEGRIKVDPTKNPERMTFHDSCNNARSGGFFEEPRELLRLVSMDFQEMYPNRAENYCCTGGGGAMSMSEYTPKRLQSAKVKADQIRATGAKIVVTSCHNCVDGLQDLIKHYDLGCEVKQLVDLVAKALVLDDDKKPADEATLGEIAVEKVEVSEPLAGRKILVVDDEEDVRTFLITVFEDAGAEVISASSGDEGIAMALEHQPDLISLDLSMPGKDGVETFVELRKTEGISEIPVCVVTGHPEFRQVIYDRPVAPPEGYLGKPVDDDKLVAYAHHIIEHREEKAN